MRRLRTSLQTSANRSKSLCLLDSNGLTSKNGMMCSTRSSRHRTSYFKCLVASVRPNAATTEVLLHQQKNFAAISVLTDRKAWSHLPADQQCAARREGNRKTAFSIDKSSEISSEIHQELLAYWLLRRLYFRTC